MKADTLSLVATDGHRLALVTVPRVEAADAGRPAKAEAVEDRREILPKKTLPELDRLLRESRADVRFGRTENHLFFETGPRLLMSRKIDGQFPAYDRVIPRGNDKRIDFERERFARCRAPRVRCCRTSARAR